MWVSAVLTDHVMCLNGLVQEPLRDAVPEALNCLGHEPLRDAVLTDHGGGGGAEVHHTLHAANTTRHRRW
jgi:hypothetical protein